MMDYYSDFPGPTKKEAIKIIKNNIMKDENVKSIEYINYINIDTCISEVMSKYKDEEQIGSLTGWNVFNYKNLYESVMNLIYKNNKLYKEKMQACVISLEQHIPIDILQKIKKI